MALNDYTKFNDVAVNGSVQRPALVSSIKEALDKNGNTYVKVTLRDGFTDISAMMFKTDKVILEEQGIVEGGIADVTVSVSEYNGGKSYRLDRVAPCSDHDLTVADFIKAPPVGIDKMYDEICEIISKYENDEDGKYISIAELTLTMLKKNKQNYITSSAAVSMHHNMKGGLLYHSYRMVKSAEALCGVYDILNPELMVCGAALHDIGKIWEYSTNSVGEAEFQKAGILMGHAYIGASIIKSYVTLLEKSNPNKKCNIEKVQLLVHMILSHHGTHEFGAVVCPATAEAFALHFIDNIDAKLYVCEENYSVLDSGSITDKRPFGLDNRIYKPNFIN